MIVFCLGMPGSASTLAFNLAREIIAEATGDAVTGLEATSLEALEQGLGGPPPRAIVIRAHTASDAMLTLLGAAGARAVLTTRDPRDCIASLTTRLGGTAVHWCTEVARSLAAVGTVQARWGAQPIAYEQAAEDVPGLVAAISTRLDLDPPAATRACIAARWNRAVVAQRLGALTTAAPSIYGWRSDPMTGLNEHHLGDGRPGKWHNLAPEDAERVDRAFGTVGDPAGRAQLGRCLCFSEALFGTAARPPLVANLEPCSPIGLRVLSLCYLGVGTWRVTLRGSLPATHAPGVLHLVLGGEVRLSAELPAALPGQAQVAVPDGASMLIEHRVHEHQMEVLLEGPAAVLPDPFRPDALTLEAVLERA